MARCLQGLLGPVLLWLMFGTGQCKKDPEMFPSLQEVASQLGITTFLRAMDATNCTAFDDQEKFNNCTDYVTHMAARPGRLAVSDTGQQLMGAITVLAPSDDVMVKFTQQQDNLGLSADDVKQHIVESCPLPMAYGDAWSCMTRVHVSFTVPAWQIDGKLEDVTEVLPQIAAKPVPGGYKFFGLASKVAQAAAANCLRFQVSGVLCKVDALTKPMLQNDIAGPLDYLAKRKDMTTTLAIIKGAQTPPGQAPLRRNLTNNHGTFFAPTNDAWSAFFLAHNTNLQDFVKTPQAYWTLSNLILKKTLVSTATFLRDDWSGLDVKYVAMNLTALHSTDRAVMAPYQPWLIGRGIPERLVARLVQGNFDIAAGGYYVHVIDRVPPICDYPGACTAEH